MAYTAVRSFGSDEDIKMGYTNGKVLVTLLVNVYGITLGIDAGIDLGSLDRYFDDSYDDTL